MCEQVDNVGTKKNQHKNAGPFVDHEGPLITAENRSQESAPSGLYIHSGKAAGGLIAKGEHQQQMEYSLGWSKSSYFLCRLCPLFPPQAQEFPQAPEEGVGQENRKGSYRNAYHTPKDEREGWERFQGRPGCRVGFMDLEFGIGKT